MHKIETVSLLLKYPNTSCLSLYWQCKPEYKVPGLYVIDSIVRQSRHQFGTEKDVFAPRFSKNIIATFQHLYRCPSDDKVRQFLKGFVFLSVDFIFVTCHGFMRVDIRHLDICLSFTGIGDLRNSSGIGNGLTLLHCCNWVSWWIITDSEKQVSDKGCKTKTLFQLLFLNK